MLSLAGEEQPYVELTAAEEASFATSREQSRRGEFANDDEVRAVWAKYGR